MIFHLKDFEGFTNEEIEKNNDLIEDFDCDSNENCEIQNGKTKQLDDEQIELPANELNETKNVDIVLSDDKCDEIKRRKRRKEAKSNVLPVKSKKIKQTNDEIVVPTESHQINQLENDEMKIENENVFNEKQIKITKTKLKTEKKSTKKKIKKKKATKSNVCLTQDFVQPKIDDENQLTFSNGNLNDEIQSENDSNEIKKEMITHFGESIKCFYLIN